MLRSAQILFFIQILEASKKLSMSTAPIRVVKRLDPILVEIYRIDEKLIHAIRG